MKLTDEELEKMLRHCGEELRRRSDELAEGAMGSFRQDTIHRALDGAAEAKKSAERRTSRGIGSSIREWLVPAQLAVACVLLLCVAFAVRGRGREQSMTAGPVSSQPVEAASLGSSEPEMLMAEVDSAFSQWHEEVSGDDEDDSSDDEDDSDVYPDYEPLVFTDTQILPLEENEDETTDYAQS